MRIISLVPSWTETLIAAGHLPVGRTRYCLHPKAHVPLIPIVGGTKQVDWQKIRSLKPDLLILDQEENPKEFSQQGLPFWASHVTNGAALADGFQKLSQILENRELNRMHLDMLQICRAPSLLQKKEAFPGCLDILKPWQGHEDFSYVIWKDPWMVVHPDTYIGYVLDKLGYKLKIWQKEPNLYPQIQLEADENHAYFFSSEPFPFCKKKAELKRLGVKGALVDGESFSWFGIRSLNFLKRALQIP